MTRTKLDMEKEIKQLFQEIGDYPELWRKEHQEKMCPVMDAPSVYFFDRVIRINMLFEQLKSFIVLE